MTNVPGVDTLSRASAWVDAPGVGGGDGEVLERQQHLTAPRTSLNGPISPHRRFSFGSIPLADVKTVKDALRADGQRRRDGDVHRRAAPLADRRTTSCRDEPLLAMVPGVGAHRRAEAASSATRSR